ncbi:hypothetical protein WDU94_013960 [Cyamophila willieti]
MKIFNNIVRITTWNVNNLRTDGKLENVEAEMKRLNIDILGMSEVRWSGTGMKKNADSYIYYSGGSDVNNYYGVAILVKPNIQKSVIDFIPISDRVMMLKLNTNFRTLNLIQVYAPTRDKSDADVEAFYSDIEKVLESTKKGELTFVIGDFNAKVGKGAAGDAVGNYGLGMRNERGDRLIQFCIEQNMFATNTFFKQHPRRLYTWTSPKDSKENIIRNQIDYILLPKAFRKFVKSVKTFPGADINSDHNPVVCDFKMEYFKTARKTKHARKIDIRKLKDSDFKKHISEKLEQKLRVLEVNEPNNLQSTFNALEIILVDTQENEIGHSERRGKQEWMTEDILEMMEERRKFKLTNKIEYKRMKKEIRKRCREEKENWLSEKCKDMETLMMKHDSFNLHKNVKEFTGTNRKMETGILKDEQNNIIIGTEEKLKRWKDYIEKLFSDHERSIRSETQTDIGDEENDFRAAISKEEIKHAVKAQKNGKAVGPDAIHCELIKVITETDATGLQKICSLFNIIYKSGNIPTSWLKSTFITLPKKPKASQCDDYRMISLMSHLLKIFLRIIHTRIYSKCESFVGDTQFGFRNGFGTREALFSLNVLTQRYVDVNENIYACFIDYRKAFDCVQHDKMMSILTTLQLNKHDLKIIQNLYWNQTAAVRLNQDSSEAILIQKGVRQGCVLSPLLFNVYSETIFKETIAEINKGIKINNRMVNNLRYADDTVIMASNVEDLQQMLNLLVTSSEQQGLYINTSKTKAMTFSKKFKITNITINNLAIEQVHNFKYLGTNITENTSSETEIKSRIEQARRAFTNMKNFFVRNDLSLGLRIRMIRCYIFSILLYGCESWTMNLAMEKRIEAFEMYLYRRILKISWMQKIMNVEVLNHMQKEKELLQTIKERKIQYLGHILRGEKYALLQLIFQGNIEGKRSRGRPRKMWMDDIMRWTGLTSSDIINKLKSRTETAIVIANLRSETA